MNDPWQAVLDARVSAVIADMCTTHRPGDQWDAAALFAAVAATVAERGLPGGTGRHPATRQRLVCLAAVYGRYFRPGPAWELTDADLDAGLLAWAHRGGARLVDAPRTGHGSSPLVSPAAVTASQADDPRLRGVRLLALTAPLTSQLLTPRGQLTELPDLHSPDPTQTVTRHRAAS
jgi:hypothetical protein